MNVRRHACLVSACSAALLLVTPGSASAASISVNTTADEDVVNNGQCALREAISSANTDMDVGGCVGLSGYGDDFILIPGGTYRLTVGGGMDDLNQEGDLDVDEATSDDVTIRRAGSAPVTVDGGGIDRVFHIEDGQLGTARIDGLTIRGGSAQMLANGGGLFNASQVIVTNSTFTGNFSSATGGGVTNGAGTALLQNVTVSGNRAEGSGGGIAATNGGDTITLENVTVTNNVADDDNGGIAGDGGGITASPGDIEFRNSVVAGNADRSGQAPDCSSNPTSLGNNVVQSTTGCGFLGIAGDEINQPARVGPLAANGGPTSTVALLAGSPAINLGNNPTCTTTDQRGLSRALGGACDGGAYERVLCRGTTVNRIGTPGNDTLAGTGGIDGILGFAGRDTLKGLAGNDTLCGGTGNDRLIGGRGRDRLFGEAGKDRMIGGPKRDLCVGGAGRDIRRKC